MVVTGNHSMSAPISAREDPPEPTLSLSPRGSRSGKDGRRQKKKSSSNGFIRPASPTKNRGSSRNSMDILPTVSREPPESGRGFSDNHEERFASPTQKGAEPPAQETLLPPAPSTPVIDVESGKHKDAPASGEGTNLAVPHEFKKSRSMRSTRSATGSRRSSSRRSKKIRIPLEMARSEADAAAASNSLNGVFNGHLMKWRFEAEEGGPFLRVPAFCGSTALIITTTYGLIFDPNTWTILSIVISLFIYAIALLSLVLEGRFMCTNPLGIRAHLRSALTRKNRIFRFVWGRGLLYIVAGGLSSCLVLVPSMMAGIFMAVVGLHCVVLGAYSARMFYLLRDSLKDDDYLAEMFNRYDFDGDGYITLPEFVNLLSKLGMDLDDRIGIKAFHAADVDHEYKISFQAFQTWWKSSFLKNGKAPRLDEIYSDLGSDEEEGSMYRRMG